MEKRQPFNKWPTGIKNDGSLMSYTKMNSEWAIDLNVKL